MLTFKKGVAPPKGQKQSEDDIVKRQAQIQEIIMLMDVDTYTEIEINNPSAWAVSFTGMVRRNAPGKKFTRRKGDHEGDETFDNLYTIWRTK